MPGRATHSRSYYRTVGRLFPRENQLARWMIPVATIRSDLVFELRLIAAADDLVHQLTGSRGASEEFHARMYFFRGTMRALYSARRVVQQLAVMEEFQTMIEPVRVEFDRLNGLLGDAASEFNLLRNEAAAHAEGAMADSRDAVDDAEVVAIEMNNTIGVVSHHISSPFLACALLGLSSADDALARAQARLERMQAAGDNGLRMMDLLLRRYLAGR